MARDALRRDDSVDDVAADGATLTGTSPVIARGRYEVSAAMDDALRKASGAPLRGSDGHAHPVFAFVVALGGMGENIATLCARLGLPFDTGAMLGRCRIAYDRALMVDRTYDVAGQVVSISRKASRRFGWTDHVHLALSVKAGSTGYAIVELTMIVPVAIGAA